MTEKFDYEILVIGAGPGGYETAIKAAQLGKKTCIIEREAFGGTCLNVGCIPTKTLIKTAEVLTELKEAERFGITGIDKQALKADMRLIQQRKQKVVSTLVNGIKGLLRGNKVDILEGSASFLDEHTLCVSTKSGDKKVSGENIIIATGSSVWMPPFIELKGKNHILTSTEALALETLPETVCVIGGGVIGVEFAYLLNSLGCSVTVLELTDHILPMVDREVSEQARKRMEKDGIHFCLGAKVSRVENDHVFFSQEGKEQAVKAEAVLMAVGRIPNTDGLKAETIGLAFEKKAIKVNEHLQTTISHIYAIGDVNGKVMLAHTASHEGMVALKHICGEQSKMVYEHIPSCIYLKPEIACIGLTEEQAGERCGAERIKIGRFRMAANGKSMVEGDTDGLFKVIVQAETGEILGAHLYGQHVTEMIGEISAAIAAEATAEEMIHAIHPHPTINEAMGEAFLAAWDGKAINAL